MKLIPSNKVSLPVLMAVSFRTSATGAVLPMLPITIGAALLFVIVLVAGRRRK
jgi:hypothetical protein